MPGKPLEEGKVSLSWGAGAGHGGATVPGAHGRTLPTVTDGEGQLQPEPRDAPENSHLLMVTVI